MDFSKNAPLVSIILITYRDQRHLKKLLPILKQNTNYPNYEIILIDNANPERIEKWIKKGYPEIQYYRLEKNLGFGRANNIGMKYANGKYFVFLNTDTLPQQNWLNALVEIAEIKPEIGIVGCPLAPPEALQQNITVTQQNYMIPVPYVEGAGFLYRANLAEESSIGKFDRFLFFYSEDADLSYRVWLANKRVVVSTRSYIIHNYIKDDKKSISDKKSRFYVKSLLYLLLKYEPIHIIIRELAIILLSLGTAMIIKKDFNVFKGKIKGILDILIKAPFIISVRNSMKKKYTDFFSSIHKIHVLQLKTGLSNHGSKQNQIWIHRKIKGVA
jgi:GT2 family glycosyltransferase